MLIIEQSVLQFKQISLKCSMLKNIIITGAAGFIGSQLSNRFIKKNNQIIGIDYFKNDQFADIKKKRLSYLTKNKNFKYLRLDILNNDKMIELVKSEKPTFLIHCAAKTGVRASVKNPLEYFKVNVLGTQVILEAFRQYSPKTKLILFSSSSVYGLQDKMPFSEEMQPNPQSPYGVTKYLMEIIAKCYFDFYQLSLVIVRPFSVYGPWGRLDMAPFLIIKSARKNLPFIQYGDNNNNKRDWTYIDDLIDGTISIANFFSFNTFEIFNLGSGKTIGINDLLQCSKKLLNKYLKKEIKVITKPKNQEELPLTLASINKSRKILGYKPKVNLEKGLNLYYLHYLKFSKFYDKILKK